MLRSFLRREVAGVGRRHVATLMKRMGIASINRRPNTSKTMPGHRIHPYLLRGVKIERPNQVWAMDISYIPMGRGFVYLAAVVDVASRHVPAHRVSITMEASFCVEALDEQQNILEELNRELQLQKMGIAQGEIEDVRDLLGLCQ